MNPVAINPGSLGRHIPPGAGAQDALSAPIPTRAKVSDAVRSRYAFLADLDCGERIIARAREQARRFALKLLAGLPGGGRRSWRPGSRLSSPREAWAALAGGSHRHGLAASISTTRSINQRSIRV
jgi:hypothetical protein